MSVCPITYAPCDGRYSKAGLKMLSRSLSRLDDFPYSALEQIREAAARATKMSIQGVQPKLSAVLKPRKNGFEVVDSGGRFILKPQNPQYPELPENEDLSMRMAAAAGVDVPLHGLIYAVDGSRTYFIKRFDRVGKNKIAVEDFAQLMGLSRETKYNSSMEQVARVVSDFCTFPAVENQKLFRLTLVNFLLGNEDMHVKNFSLITREGKVALSPAYDILSTTIVLSGVVEEMALPLLGKKRKLDASMLIDYFGHERLNLKPKIVSRVIGQIEAALPEWQRLIDISFLSDTMKAKYRDLVASRSKRLLG